MSLTMILHVAGTAFRIQEAFVLDSTTNTRGRNPTVSLSNVRWHMLVEPHGAKFVRRGQNVVYM